MKKYFSLLVVLLMVFTLSGSAVNAKDSDGDGKDDQAEELCKNGGFATLKDAAGKVFVSEQACEDFFDKDDDDKDANRCRNGGFATLRDAAGKVFVSEQACVTFFNQDGDEDSDDDDSIRSDNSGKGNNNALRDAARKKFEDLKNEIKNEKDAAKAKVKELRINVRENALQRFDAAVTRIRNLKDRVNTLMVKLEAKGVVVTNAKSLLVTAETKLSAAQVKITEINTILAVSINELSAADRTKLRILANDTQTLIRDAHEALKNAVKSLKDALKVKMEAENEVDDSN